MATTAIGSFISTMSPVRAKPIFLSVGLLLSLGGCFYIEESPQVALKWQNAKETCQKNCHPSSHNVLLSQSIHIEVEPTQDLAQVFYAVDPQTLAHKPLIMAEKILVKGQALDAESYIKNDAEGSNQDIRGPYSDIIALPLANNLNFLSPRIPNLKTRLTSNLDYELNLLSNVSYGIILNPHGSYGRAPRIIFPSMMKNNKSFNFPQIKKEIKIVGRISSKKMMIFSGNQDPHFQIGVFQGSRLISSLATIGKNGDFSLELSNPPLIDLKKIPATLVIEPINTEAALPRIQKVIDLTQNSPIINIGNIALGQLSEPFLVSIKVIGADNSIVDNAYIYLNAQVGNGEAKVKKEVDPTGITSFADIYEGTYDIAIIPRTNSKFAMFVMQNVRLKSGQTNELEIKLVEKKLMSATIRDHFGNPLNGAQLELYRIGKVGDIATEDIFDDMLFKLTASTNQEGLVCSQAVSMNKECDKLALDDGRYLAHIIPPTGSKLSHKWVTFDFPEQNTLAIDLSKPQILTGKILASDHKTPIKQAFVTIYLAQTNTHNQPAVIGSTITDENGTFEAFVPSENLKIGQ